MEAAKSEKMAERGGEREERRGERRCSDWVICNQRMKKGSSISVGVVGLSGNWRQWMWGWSEKKVERWWDSAADTAGAGVMRVMVQLWEERRVARRRKGARWPMPALGKRATCSGLWCEESEFAITVGAGGGGSSGQLGFFALFQVGFEVAHGFYYQPLVLLECNY